MVLLRWCDKIICVLRAHFKKIVFKMLNVTIEIAEIGKRIRGQ